MSFRLFVYVFAVCGGWAAFLGWALGRLVAGVQPFPSAGLKGLCLGLLVALALAVADAVWNFSRGQLLQALPRVLTAVLVGATGGLIGGVAGQWLFDRWAPLYVLGWTITGFLVGASLGTFDVLYLFVRQEEVRGARRKILNGLLGGTAGGLLGGVLSALLPVAWGKLFPGRSIQQLWSPSATGFVALGVCIGLMIGLAQVLLKEAWIKVEAGFRAGRELLLTKPEVTIGRAEGCDIGLFGDPAIDRLHARLLLRDNRYVLEDAGSATGTFVNGQRVSEPVPLQSGDAIQLGKCVLRFGERRKQSPAA